MDNKDLVKLLVVLGGIVGLIESISSLVGAYGFFSLFIFSAIIGLVAAILVLLSVFQGKPIPYEPIYMIILSILMILFGATIGGILVIIGGILWLINK